MSNKYADTFEVVNNMAKVKMAMNNHKGNIEDCPEGQIIKKMHAEIVELENAVIEGKTIDVIEEAADVMNFLIALVHQQVNKYRER